MAREALKNHPAAGKASGAVTALLESSQRAMNLLLQLRHPTTLRPLITRWWLGCRLLCRFEACRQRNEPRRATTKLSDLLGKNGPLWLLRPPAVSLARLVFSGCQAYEGFPGVSPYAVIGYGILY